MYWDISPPPRNFRNSTLFLKNIETEFVGLGDGLLNLNWFYLIHLLWFCIIHLFLVYTFIQSTHVYGATTECQAH